MMVVCHSAAPTRRRGQPSHARFSACHHGAPFGPGVAVPPCAKAPLPPCAELLLPLSPSGVVNRRRLMSLNVDGCSAASVVKKVDCAPAPAGLHNDTHQRI